MSKNTMGSVIKNENFRNVDLSGTSFELMKLEGCDFTGANLEGVKFYKCIIKNCNFTDSQAKEVVFDNCELESTLFYSVLVNTKFIECAVESCKFSRTLLHCEFDSSDIKSTSFAKARIIKSNFTEISIKNVDFTHATLQRVAGLKYTSLTETSDSGVNVEILYILPTNTVYLSTEYECVSMSLDELADYIESWYTSENPKGLDYIINLERLKIIENYLQMVYKGMI